MLKKLPLSTTNRASLPLIFAVMTGLELLMVTGSSAILASLQAACARIGDVDRVNIASEVKQKRRECNTTRSRRITQVCSAPAGSSKTGLPKSPRHSDSPLRLVTATHHSAWSKLNEG
jgi:hypothetical protein